MSPYRHPDPAVRKEMRRQRRLGGTRYGQDSRRRARQRQDAERAKGYRLRRLATVIVLVAAALVIIGWDHERGTFHLDRPVEPADVTATVPPHPATTGSHP